MNGWKQRRPIMDEGEGIFNKSSSKGIIFISYSRKEQPIAKKLYDVLEQQNIPCFLASEDIIGSINWITEITKCLKNSWLLLLLITPDSTRSKYVLREVTIAASKDIPIYPVILKPTELTEEITFLISPHHVTDYSKYDWPEPITLILKNIQKLSKVYSYNTITPSTVHSRDREIFINKNRLPLFVQIFDWMESDVSEEVETAIKSLPLPEPLEDKLEPDEWIITFQTPFTTLFEHSESKQWLQRHFEKLAFGQRGLTSFILFDAVLSVPPLAKIFNAVIRQLEQSWKTGIFAKTGTGKSRLLTYIAHYWRKKRDRPVLFIDHPQGITQDHWNEWLKTLRLITDRNTKFPILIIIEDLHSVHESIKEQISSFIQQAGPTTYAIICTFTVSEQPYEDEKEKYEREYWEQVIYSGMDRLDRFESYWELWQPYFLAYLKWMAPTILKRKIPERWKDVSQKIFQSYQSPWSFVVGLGFLEQTFKDEFLSKESDPLDKLLYLLIHVLFLCNNEIPILVDSYIRFLQRGLKNLVSDAIYSKLKHKTIELLQKWSSREKRLLPSGEFSYYGFEKHALQSIYHQEWAKEVVRFLYTNNSDLSFKKMIDNMLKQVYYSGFLLWESLQYENKPKTFLNWLIKSVQSLNQDDLLSLGFLNLSSIKITTLPESIGELKFLKKMDLSLNKLTSLPDSITKLKTLEILDLRSNDLLILPESINKLKNLEILDLRSNNLTTLPESIGEIESLKVLYLWYNRLIKLPESIGNLGSLEKLDLELNKLTKLPKSIENLNSLRIFNLERNLISSLPESMTTMTSLQKLYISNNPLDTEAEIVLQKLRKRGINVSM